MNTLKLSLFKKNQTVKTQNIESLHNNLDLYVGKF